MGTPLTTVIVTELVMHGGGRVKQSYTGTRSGAGGLFMIPGCYPDRMVLSEEDRDTILSGNFIQRVTHGLGAPRVFRIGMIPYNHKLHQAMVK